MSPRKIHNNQARNLKILPASGGASYVEAAVTIPVVLVMIFFLIDLGRYFFVSVVLNHAAQAAADEASKIEVETSTTTIACPNNNPEPCVSYKTRIQGLLNQAVGTAQMVASLSNQDSSVKLTRFEHYNATDYGVYGSGITSFWTDAAFLRPGEMVREDLGNGSTIIHNHPTRPYPGPQPQNWTVGTGWPKAPETWELVLETNPLQVMLIAGFKPVTFFFPTVKIQAVQHAYRRTKIFGVGAPPIPYTAAPTLTRTPTRTRTPTNTNDPNNTATATPTITGTPTLTRTPTITATFTPDPCLSIPDLNQFCANCLSYPGGCAEGNANGQPCSQCCNCSGSGG